MGERKRKRAKFFSNNPFCCFCGGRERATTVDHVPNRASFPGRVGPEGFEFPACAKCQTETRLDEVAFAFMVHFLAEERDVPDEASRTKIIQGLKNNLPHLTAFREPTTREKRQAARDLDLRLPPGPISEAPLLQITPGWAEHIERYIAKLAKALYYKHLGDPVPADWVPWTMWTYDRIQINRPALQRWIEMTPFITIGERSNTDLGDRFIYRANHNEELGVFAAVGRFGGGLIFYATLMEPDLADRMRLDELEEDGSKQLPSGAR